MFSKPLQLQPLYKHDRTCCRYMATIGDADLYICDGSVSTFGEATLLARFDNEPSKNSSMSVSSTAEILRRHPKTEVITDLMRAYWLAKALGEIT